MALEEYKRKRDFKKTVEPKGKLNSAHKFLYVIQKHAASHLHYDFRLELDGVLLSWAVPKGPCFDPSVKRLAMHVEDHPVAYGSFQGIIPKGQYGSGAVMLWDKGIWTPLDENPAQAYHHGHLRFELHAEKLKGRWDLIRFKDEKHWFLIKHRDEWAQKLTDYDVTIEEPDSVINGYSIEEIAEQSEHVWHSNRGSKMKKAPPHSKKINLPAALKSNQFPDFISVQLATLVDRVPEGSKWLHEIKFDGYRILARINLDEVVLKSRNNKDWTQDLIPVANALRALSLKQVIFDGEVVVLNQQGKSDFQLLQNVIKGEGSTPLIYYIFDLLFYDQYDLRSLPLVTRKALLKSVLPIEHPILKYSDHIINDGEEMFRHACSMALEGIVSKEVNSPYISKRSKSWLKVKCIKRQEFVIGGYTLSQNGRDFRSLYLGVFDGKKLIYTGKVGTGFTQKALREIFIELKKYETKKSPFSTRIPASSKVVWVKPVLVGEVEFSQWTQGGHLRHPSFKGLRIDKKAHEVKKEQEISLAHIAHTTNKKRKTGAHAQKSSSIILTHPDKVLYPEEGITKKELLSYYEAVSDYLLPYIINRPLSLVRCPQNFKRCFFQRHFNESTLKKLKAITVQEKKNVEELIYLDNTEGLFSLVQMDVLEIHPWGSLINQLDNPDILVIDLDPAPDVAWQEIVQSAREIKQHLAEFKLTSFVKTTGGKGLHVVIPIKPEYSWEEVKNFAHTFVVFLEQLKPEKYISKIAKTKRSGKIFVDYLRNQKGATAVAAYSTRARPHAPVSVPIHWDELTAQRKDTEFTIKNVPPRLIHLKHDPWEGFGSMHQSLRLKQID
ncbi:DNA ligase D [Legionella sp.]|uniref:DNA ligase D n=1 Tax=Legionella sp. TaxID=459 RepID=UPI003CAA8E7A